MEQDKQKSVEDEKVNHEIPPQIYQKALNQLMKEKLQTQYTLDYESVCTKGENYIGVLYRATAKSDTKTFHVVLKIPSQNKARRKVSYAAQFFDREILFYQNVLPIFENFQNQKEISELEIFVNVPKCFKILSDEPNEGIFLEDLKNSGFKVFDRFENLTKNHVDAVMRTLGKFHAISLSIKDQKPELIEPFMTLKDVLLKRLTDKELNTSTRSKLVTRAINVVLESNNEILIDKVKKLFSKDFCELFKECVDGVNAEPFAAICHGDCYNNNIMFKYDKDGQPIDVRLIDFQVVRYASPVCDLLYYIFVCTSKELRREFYQEFLNLYYESFTKFTKKLSSDPEKTLPRNVFENHLKRFGHFGILMATLALPYTTAKQENLPNLDKIAEKIVKAKNGDVEKLYDKNLSCFTQSSSKRSGYNEKILGVFEDMSNFGYI